ncbi:MAG: hypothetical protein AB7E79_03645 [Rhodospirillaceae bacterium]
MFVVLVLLALVLTYSGAEALVDQVNAAGDFKSSVITFILTLGFALLGPALLTAAFYVHRRSDSRGPRHDVVPATPKQVYPPYLHGH